MDLIRRIDWTAPRTFWQVSWMAAGAIVLLAGIIQGSLPFGAAVGTYFGFGAGVELTLFVAGRRTQTGYGPKSANIISTETTPPVIEATVVPPPAQVAPPVEPATPAQVAPEDDMLIAGLCNLGYRMNTARKLAAETSSDLPLSTRMLVALQRAGLGK